MLPKALAAVLDPAVPPIDHFIEWPTLPPGVVPWAVEEWAKARRMSPRLFVSSAGWTAEVEVYSGEPDLLLLGPKAYRETVIDGPGLFDQLEREKLRLSIDRRYGWWTSDQASDNHMSAAEVARAVGEHALIVKAGGAPTDAKVICVVGASAYRAPSRLREEGRRFVRRPYSWETGPWALPEGYEYEAIGCEVRGTPPMVYEVDGGE